MTRIVHDEDGPSALRFGWDSNPWVWVIEFKRAEGPIREGCRSRPILFRGEIVLAILEGRKTQTRRPVKLPSPDGEVYIDPGGTIFGPGPYVKNYKVVPGGDAAMHPRIRCPYGYPDDRLWVKETHAIVDYPAWPDLPHTIKPSDEHHPPCAYYRAGFDRSHGFRWRPSIHMPRWAARVEVEIVSVRVERLHAITEDDARAEGIEAIQLERRLYPSGQAATAIDYSYREGFAHKWREIHGDGSARAA